MKPKMLFAMKVGGDWGPVDVHVDVWKRRTVSVVLANQKSAPVIADMDGDQARELIAAIENALNEAGA